MDINRRNMADLYVAFRAAFQRGLRSREDLTAWARIATRIPSSTAKNVYPFLGQWPKLREWLDERTIKQLGSNRYELANRDFESTVEVERNAVEDDEYMLYAPLFEEAGGAAAEWPDDVVFEVLKAGLTGLGYDDVPFFSASHPHVKDGAVANLSGAGSHPAWYLLDTTRVLKPLIWQPRRLPKIVRLDRETDENVFHHKKFLYGIDARGAAGYGLWQLARRSTLEFTDANFAAERAAMMELTNNEGSSLGINPNLVVAPPEIEFKVRKVLAAAANAQGASNVLQGMADVYITNRVRE